MASRQPPSILDKSLSKGKSEVVIEFRGSGSVQARIDFANAGHVMKFTNISLFLLISILVAVNKLSPEFSPQPKISIG